MYLGVYWDDNQKAFKSTPLNEWTESKWFMHIKDIVKSGLNIELSFDDNLKWNNIQDRDILGKVSAYEISTYYLGGANKPRDIDKIEWGAIKKLTKETGKYWGQ